MDKWQDFCQGLYGPVYSMVLYTVWSFILYIYDIVAHILKKNIDFIVTFSWNIFIIIMILFLRTRRPAFSQKVNQLNQFTAGKVNQKIVACEVSGGYLFNSC